MAKFGDYTSRRAKTCDKSDMKGIEPHRLLQLIRVTTSKRKIKYVWVPRGNERREDDALKLDYRAFHE
jgi:hypothetical protein